MSDKQTDGRTANGAEPGGKPDTLTSTKDVKENGRRETKTAGPDGPDGGEIGKTFKKTGG